MALNTDYVTEQLIEQDFNILDMVQDPETDILVLTIVHDLHPDDEFKVSLISKDEDGNDTMQMQFDGPDIYTEEEAKQVLQEVMDVLVTIIENALVDLPDETLEENTQSGGDDEDL